MDVAVHVGSLLAVMLYFSRDVWQILVGIGRISTGRGGDSSRLVGNLVLASIPVLVVGYFYHDIVATVMRDPRIIAGTTIGFGLLLWIADRVGMTIRRMEHLRWASALTIGAMQVLALVPGTSRSGITMTAGRILGMERSEAARFSMLLSIPTISAAGGFTAWKIYQAGDIAVTADMLMAAGMSFIAALVSLAFMMAWLRRSGFGIFVLYRILLGGALLYWIYGPPLSAI